MTISRWSLAKLSNKCISTYSSKKTLMLSCKPLRKSKPRAAPILFHLIQVIMTPSRTQLTFRRSQFWIHTVKWSNRSKTYWSTAVASRLKSSHSIACLMLLNNKLKMLKSRRRHRRKESHGSRMTSWPRYRKLCKVNIKVRNLSKSRQFSHLRSSSLRLYRQRSSQRARRKLNRSRKYNRMISKPLRLSTRKKLRMKLRNSLSSKFRKPKNWRNPKQVLYL